MSQEPEPRDESPFGRETAGDPIADGRPSSPERPRLTHRPFTPGDAQSLLDEHSSFSGKYESSRNLLVEGRAEGEIECEGRLTVAQGATVKARVVAAEITVAGALDGEIVCNGLLEVLPSGRVQGTITTERLVVQEGAYCDGTIHMSDAPAPQDGEADGAAGGSPTSIFQSPVRKVE